MKISKTILALALGVMLILSGCSGNSDSSGTSSKVSPSTATATNINGSTAAINETDDVIISTGENKTEETIEAVATGGNATQNAAVTNGSAASTANPSETAKPTMTSSPSGSGSSSSGSSSSSNGSSGSSSTATSSATAKPTASATTTTAKPTQTQASSSSTPTPTKKPTTSSVATATKKPTATPTVTSSPQTVTYSFYPSSVTVYSGDDTPVNLKIKDSNGNNRSIAELDLDWYDYDGEGNLNFNRGSSQRDGAYILSDSNIARLSAMRYTDGTEKLTTDGYWGKLGTCTIKVRHISGQILTLTVTSIKDTKYAAYYHPYDFAAIDADLKAYVEAHNGVYDPTLDPSFAGYNPGNDSGGYTLQGKCFYEYCRKAIFAVIESIVLSNPDHPYITTTLEDWGGMRFYLWRQHTTGTVGADDECYLFRALYFG